MNILIAGGSGFIGQNLSKYLAQADHNITILTRKKNTQSAMSGINYLTWDGKSLHTSHHFDAIINLCGESISDKKWSAEQKEKITQSRIQPTKALLNFIKKSENPKTRLINASAIGFYTSHEIKQTETDFQDIRSLNFSQHFTRQWETLAHQASHHGAQVCCIRLGVVLGKEGGIIQKMTLPFQYGLGMTVGNPNYKMSWIHIMDVCRAIEFLLSSENLEKTYNLTAPVPCSQKEFAQAMAHAMHRPCFFRMPGIMVKTIFGDMGKELMLANQSIFPHNLVKAGFTFSHKNISEAMKNIFS